MRPTGAHFSRLHKKGKALFWAGKKWIKFDLPPAGGKLCEAFLG